MSEDVRPMEEIDPELAEHFKQIAAGNHPQVQTLHLSENEVLIGVKPSTVEKVGRNDPCPCGSGKKYKKCCINKS